MTSTADSPPDGISCIIPVFNESPSIEATVRGAAAALDQAGRTWEIIVVDDGSTDASLEAAGGSGVQFRSIRHERNLGYGAAIKSGIRRAAHPWILIIDADGTYPTEEIGGLIAALDENESLDMIVGRRTQTRETDGFFRLQGKAMLTALANFLSGERIPDLNSGRRLMRRSLVERYWPVLPNGFSLTTSVTLSMHCSGAMVTYVPIEYRAREGKSKIRPMRDTANFIALILRTIVYFNPLKVFVPLSIAFVVAAFATALISEFMTGQVMDVTALFLFIAGLQMLLIGVIADLILKLTGMREK